MPEGTELTPSTTETTEADSPVMALLQEIMGVVTNLQQSVEALAPVEPAAVVEPEAEPVTEPEAVEAVEAVEETEEDLSDLESKLQD